MGIASPIGIGKAEVARALFAGIRGLTLRDDLIPGHAVYVGQVSAPLPRASPGLQTMECRNGRLMLAAVLEIAEAVEEAANRLGRDRIAVVMGTSTSGIAEGEAAYGAVRRDGVWPAGFPIASKKPETSANTSLVRSASPGRPIRWQRLALRAARLSRLPEGSCVRAGPMPPLSAGPIRCAG
jgi:hypothetical protein